MVSPSGEKEKLTPLPSCRHLFPLLGLFGQNAFTLLSPESSNSTLIFLLTYSRPLWLPLAFFSPL